MNLALSIVLGFVAASLAVPLANRVFRRLQPVQQATKGLLGAEERGPELRKWNRAYQQSIAAGAVVLCLLWWPCLVLAAHVLIPVPDGLFRFFVPAWEWLAPAMGLGLITSTVVVEAVSHRLLGGRYEDFVRYRDSLSGYSFRGVAWFVFPAAVLLIAIGSVLLADSYVCFSEREIVISGFWSLGERRYGYLDIVSIRTAPEFVAPNGSVVKHRAYVFRFTDGSSWCTLNEPSGASISVIEELARFVSSHSGRALVELPRFQRKDL